MNLENFMNKSVICCKKSDSIVKISNVMKENDIGFIPIVDDKKVIGVITDRDIVVKCISNNDIDGDITNYMTKDIISVSLENSIYDTLDIMKKYKIKRILVDDNKRLVGVLSISDILNSNIDTLDAVKSIWAINPSEHKYDTDIDDFYL